MSPLEIYTIDQKRCNNCFKCVRECPFDAISFYNDKAAIAYDRCIDCGICFSICPVDAIDYKDGVPKVKQLIKKQDLTVASLAPNWTSEFRGVKEEQMIEALKLLGIKHVSPTAMGAAASVEAMTHGARLKNGVTIGTTCPVVTATITNFYPHLTHLLSDTGPAHIVHAKMLRKVFGNNAKIIYISSCPAVFGGGEIDLAITFKELDIWLKEENIDFDKIPGNVEGYHFEPKNVRQKPDYIIPGHTMDSLTDDTPINVACSGMGDIKKILGQIDDDTMRRQLFLDLFACRGGCVNGLFSIDPNRTVDSKHYFLQSIKSTNGKDVADKNNVKVDVTTSWQVQKESGTVKPEKIEEIVNYLKIDNLSPNCGGCGYDTCRDFAKGVLTRMTNIENCTLNKKRTDKTDNELFVESLHCGIVFINSMNMISLYNKRFAKIMKIEKISREAITSQNVYDHLIAKNLKDITDTEVEVNINNKLYYVSKLTFLNNSCCFIIRNIIEGNTSDEVEKRTKDLIKENMETMQKIASLLGENAARVEGVLRSFVEKR